MSHNLLHNPERYKSCFCNKNDGNNIVELLEFPEEQTGTSNIFQQEIVFVIRGYIQITIEGFTIGRRLKIGEFVFLPAGARLTYEALPDTAILIVRVSGDVPECPVFRMDGVTGNITIQRDPTGLHALKTNKRVDNFISELLETLSDGFLCRHYLQSEANRLLFILNAYYSEEDRVRFFAHILTPDIKFSEFVRMNHMKYRTIGELSGVLCMTTQAFSNRFKRVFGMTPHKWMLREKARHIYNDICKTNMPLKEIALKYDFPLSSNFFRFCKHTFGESPGRIRKNLYRNQ